MYNNDERAAVMFGLLCAFALTIVSLVIPVVGYVLLVLVCLGVVGLVVLGVVLLFASVTDVETRSTHRHPRRDVMSR